MTKRLKQGPYCGSARVAPWQSNPRMPEIPLGEMGDVTDRDGCGKEGVGCVRRRRGRRWKRRNSRSIGFWLLRLQRESFGRNFLRGWQIFSPATLNIPSLSFCLARSASAWLSVCLPVFLVCLFICLLSCLLVSSTCRSVAFRN